jgi:hypothetical protein
VDRSADRALDEAIVGCLIVTQIPDLGGPKLARSIGALHRSATPSPRARIDR